MKIFLEDAKKQLEDILVAINGNRLELESLKAEIESSKQSLNLAKQEVEEWQSQIVSLKDQHKTEIEKVASVQHETKKLADAIFDLQTKFNKENIEYSSFICNSQKRKTELLNDISATYLQSQKEKEKIEDAMKEYIDIQNKVKQIDKEGLQKTSDMAKIIDEKNALLTELSKKELDKKNSIAEQEHIIQDKKNEVVSIKLVLESFVNESKSLEAIIKEKKDRILELDEHISSQEKLLTSAKDSLLHIVGKEHTINEYVDSVKELYAKAGITINI